MPEHGHGHHGHGGQMTPEQQRQMIEQELRIAKNLGQIKHKIVVMSGKGGVFWMQIFTDQTFQKC